MGRLLLLAVVGVLPAQCEDAPYGPQPDKPIKPPGGFVPETAEPPKADAPVPAPAAPVAKADSGAPAPAPVPEAPKGCTPDTAAELSGKARWLKQGKKKKLEVRVDAKPGKLSLDKTVKVTGGTVDKVESKSGHLVAAITPTAQAKLELALAVMCGKQGPDAVVASVDLKSLKVVLANGP